ncbi:PD40 domain-containing protein [Dyadobacter psychrophilus]|uniref:WD40-like Beta Propeller Repeat n=1 Tax=Dyadobacter psychrophilus TaxID=651661 RepID=A0A1T5E6F5_9BACT|nr:PD40 domain-containing protein [Dyadobacter psychrophilus]SKB79435.1 WD40-like Beta Propeller Repeat [Dyadobacter psychrophilus]
MKRLLFLFISLTVWSACKEKAVDPSLRVRPVNLKILVKDKVYKLSWEEVRLICITAPCPDVADVEAEAYEVQITTEELGAFQTFATLSADKKSIDIPAAGRGEQLVARIVSKAEAAPPMNSNTVMATSGFLSQSAFYPGFGVSESVIGGDVTPDGKQAAYNILTQANSGEYTAPLYLAGLENEKPVDAKLVDKLGGAAKFSNDGKQLAYVSGTGNEISIYDIGSATTKRIPVENAAGMVGLDWSPDGKWLAFTTVSDLESRLWKIAAMGGSPVPLTPPMPVREANQIRPTDISWSPDGQFIAVSKARSESGQKLWRVAVSLYSPEGSGEVKYFETQPGWIDANPAFSPDGKQLAFLSTRTDSLAMSYSLWVRNVATGKVRRVELLPDIIPSDDYVPRWVGNERLVFMATQRGKRGYFSVFL